MCMSAPSVTLSITSIGCKTGIIVFLSSPKDICYEEEGMEGLEERQHDEEAETNGRDRYREGGREEMSKSNVHVGSGCYTFYHQYWL